jgi:hypothetical protein
MNVFRCFRAMLPVALYAVLALSPGFDPACAQEPQVQPQTPPAIEIQALPEAPIPIAGDAIFAPLAISRETLKTRFEDYAVLSFGPRAIVSPAVGAALRMARCPPDYPRQWCDGAEAFGRNYGDEFTRKVALQTARFGVGALLREDYRYVPAKTANGFGRLGHAVAFTIVDRSDSGHARIAFANFAGAAAGGTVPILYLPDGYNTAGHARSASITRMGTFAINNVTREFAPEIYRVFRALHLPREPLSLAPEWWTRDLSVARRP